MYRKAIFDVIVILFTHIPISTHDFWT